MKAEFFKETNTGLIVGKDNTDKLRVFSTSTIFDAERSYDKFGAYAVIFHNGDFKEAARDLRSQGYGQQALGSFDFSNALMPTNSLMPYENVGASEASRARVDEEQESSWKPIELKDYLISRPCWKVGMHQFGSIRAPTLTHFRGID